MRFNSSTTSNMTTPFDFSAIPVLDYSLLHSPATRAKFLEQVRHALINVGFLYLVNHSVSQTDIDLLINYIPKFFGLPQDVKDKIDKVHSPYFLGHSSKGEPES
jgi:isopenicillin N synthase-like dioxygenase